MYCMYKMSQYETSRLSAMITRSSERDIVRGYIDNTANLSFATVTCVWNTLKSINATREEGGTLSDGADASVRLSRRASCCILASACICIYSHSRHVPQVLLRVFRQIYNVNLVSITRLEKTDLHSAHGQNFISSWMKGTRGIMQDFICRPLCAYTCFLCLFSFLSFFLLPLLFFREMFIERKRKIASWKHEEAFACFARYIAFVIIWCNLCRSLRIFNDY